LTLLLYISPSKERGREKEEGLTLLLNTPYSLFESFT